MPLHHAVLALLADGPNHGYELKTAFEKTVGPQWGGLNIGHVYQILERAERDGFVASRREAQAVKPDRRVYHLTAAGRTELSRWLAEASARQRGYRDDFFLKLMAAARQDDPQVLGGVLARQRAHLLGELRALSEQRRSATDDPVVTLLLTAAELHVRADLDLVDAAEETDWQAAATPLPKAAAESRRRPRSTEEAPPKRRAAR